MEQIKVMNYDAQSVIPSESWGYNSPRSQIPGLTILVLDWNL